MVDEGFICDKASMRTSVNISFILNNTNTLALELNSWCNLQNSKFKHRRSFFNAKSYQKKVEAEAKNPNWAIQSDHNLPMQMLLDLGNEPSAIRRSVCIVQHRRLKCGQWQGR